ncbi:MAG TPA: STAS domain-containing protein [Mycobacteriales bacterium]|jgi:anti-sigma B factor antagonist|nr:STAS domain-containing protein [Mycobacteriales bacterium]
MAFAIEAERSGPHVVLAVSGEVDIATAPALRERLADVLATRADVVVDLADVPFMDSTGLGVLVASYNRAVAAGRRLVVARPQQIVRNALRLVQVDTVIDVYDSLDAAVAATRG